MSWRRVAAIYAVAALLAAYVFVFERSAPVGEEGAPPTIPASILGTDAATVTAVTFGKSGKVVRAQRDGDRWRVVEPVGLQVPPDLIEATIATLTTGQSAEMLGHESAGALDAYGLDAPTATVEVALTGASQPVTILIGARNPTRTAVYARRTDQPSIYLVGMNLSYYIDLIFDAADDLIVAGSFDAHEREGVQDPSGRAIFARERGVRARDDPQPADLAEVRRRRECALGRRPRSLRRRSQEEGTVRHQRARQPGDERRHADPTMRMAAFRPRIRKVHVIRRHGSGGDERRHQTRRVGLQRSDVPMPSFAMRARAARPWRASARCRGKLRVRTRAETASKNAPSPLPISISTGARSRRFHTKRRPRPSPSGPVRRGQLGDEVTREAAGE